MFGLTTAIPAAAGFIVGGLLAYFIGHSAGVDAGREMERAASRQAAMEAIEKRNEDASEISDFDVKAICKELGGRWSDAENSCT